MLSVAYLLPAIVTLFGICAIIYSAGRRPPRFTVETCPEIGVDAPCQHRIARFDDACDAIKDLAARSRQEPYTTLLKSRGLAGPIERLCQAGWGATNALQASEAAEAKRNDEALLPLLSHMSRSLAAFIADGQTGADERGTAEELYGLVQTVNQKMNVLFPTSK
jgi:hypothetical protein